jgi:hypothetical protein
MKKIILKLMILLSPLYMMANTISAKYNITYGNFLDLGIAYTTLSIHENKYSIKIEAKTTGMAKYLTNNRVEIYESHGDYIDNKFLPKKFIKIKKDDLKQKIRTYTFDNKNQKILVNEINKGYKIKFQNDLSQKKVEFSDEENSTLDYFAKDDILSLFFNLQELLIGFEDGKEYTLKAIGANKTKGKISILIPAKEQMKILDENLKIDSKSKFIAYINQRIFSSKRGELLISLNDHGFCNKAVLKDVLLFGDISGEMVEFKITKEKNEKI